MCIRDSTWPKYICVGIVATLIVRPFAIALLEPSVFASDYLRQRIRTLESQCDYLGIHAFMTGWPWPSGERPNAEAAFAEVERRVAAQADSLVQVGG